MKQSGTDKMKKERIIKILVFLLPFIYSFYASFSTGDLSRIGYINIPRGYRKSVQKDQPETGKKHITFEEIDNKPVDVIVIGDSFTDNNFFNDYFADKVGGRHLYLNKFSTERSLNTIAILANSGFLRKLKPKYLVIEIVERDCYVDKFNSEQSVTINEINNFYRAIADNKRKNERPNLAKFLNRFHYKFWFFAITYNLSENAFLSKVIYKKLNKDSFSVYSDKLYFLEEDLQSLELVNREDSVKDLNNKLNILSEKLKKEGITLVFIPAPNKYTIYQDRIINLTHPKSEFFQKFAKMHKKYVYIDSYKIIKEELENGVPDLYYLEDSHWSWKGMKLVIDQTINTINMSQQIKKTGKSLD